jgi:hypothetical protein
VLRKSVYLVDLVVMECVPVFPGFEPDENPLTGGSYVSGMCVPQFPEDPSGGGELVPERPIGGASDLLFPMAKRCPEAGDECTATWCNQTGGCAIARVSGLTVDELRPPLSQPEYPGGGGELVPEQPISGGDGYCPEAPGGGASDFVPLLSPDTCGGGGNDSPMLAVMLLPVWPDEDPSKGGKVYLGTALRNLVEVPQFPEERDAKGGKARAMSTHPALPQFPAVDDDDEEYREEDEDEDEEEEWSPTDRPWFAEVGR